MDVVILQRNNYSWFKPKDARFEKITVNGQQRTMFQREVGLFLGAIETNFLADREKTLEHLDFYYQAAKGGLDACDSIIGPPKVMDGKGLLEFAYDSSDPCAVVFFRTMAELLANYIQVFRATHGLPPSDSINKDLVGLNDAVVTR